MKQLVTQIPAGGDHSPTMPAQLALIATSVIRRVSKAPRTVSIVVAPRVRVIGLRSLVGGAHAPSTLAAGGARVPGPVGIGEGACRPVGAVRGVVAGVGGGQAVQPAALRHRPAGDHPTAVDRDAAAEGNTPVIAPPWQPSSVLATDDLRATVPQVIGGAPITRGRRDGRAARPAAPDDRKLRTGATVPAMLGGVEPTAADRARPPHRRPGRHRAPEARRPDEAPPGRAPVEPLPRRGELRAFRRDPGNARLPGAARGRRAARGPPRRRPCSRTCSSRSTGRPSRRSRSRPPGRSSGGRGAPDAPARRARGDGDEAAPPAEYLRRIADGLAANGAPCEAVVRQGGRRDDRGRGPRAAVRTGRDGDARPERDRSGGPRERRPGRAGRRPHPRAARPPRRPPRSARCGRCSCPSTARPAARSRSGSRSALARATGAGLVLVQVVVPLAAYPTPGSGGGASAWAWDPTWDERGVRAARGYVDGWPSGSGAPGWRRTAAPSWPSPGRTSRRLNATAEAVDADVVVMSTHALTGPCARCSAA